MRTANAKATASFAMDKKTEMIQMIQLIPMIPKKKLKVQKSKNLYYVFPGSTCSENSKIYIYMYYVLRVLKEYMYQ